MSSDRSRRKPDQVGRRLASSAIESLESRQLLAYSPIGQPPRLIVSGQTGPIAAYGGPLAVTLDVQNIGTSSFVEPLALAPGSTSSADAPESTVGVYLLRTPHARPGGRGSVRVGTVEVPPVEQNSLVRVTDTITLPSRLRRFPGSGGTVYVGFRTDGNIGTRRLGRIRNTAPAVPVRVNAALPDLAAIAIDLPTTLQPGDAIAPAIKIANYGTVNTNTQAPVTVLLVASTDDQFGPTDAIVGRYVISSLPGLSQAPARRVVLGDVNIDDPANVASLTTQSDGEQVAFLPAGRGYYLGVIVDPLNQIRELNEIGRGASSQLQLIRSVGNVPGLPPAGVLSAASPTGNLFPEPAYAPVNTIGQPPDFLTSAADSSFAAATASGGATSVAAARARASKRASS